ncbi:hypothetical protein BH23VER1_BH23VER1_36180 [soil metagenome]
MDMEIGLLGYLGMGILILSGVAVALGIPLFYVVLTRWVFSGGNPNPNRTPERAVPGGTVESGSPARKPASFGEAGAAVEAPEAPAVSAHWKDTGPEGRAAPTDEVVRVDGGNPAR